MDPGSIHCMYFFKPREFTGSKSFDKFMNEPPKITVFLRRPAYNSKMPDRIFTVINIPDFKNRKIMGQAVITEVISKRPFRFHHILLHHTCNTEIGIC